MGTSAPVRRTEHIPITEKPRKPAALPAPDPERVVSPFVPVPEREPEKVRRSDGNRRTI